MLDFFRQKGLSSIVYGAIIIAMVLVFLLGFNPSAGKKVGSVSEACSARVQGYCIEPKAHRAAYRIVFPRGPGRMGKATSSKIVLEGLIERELLASEAQRLGLTVSEEEVNDSIIHGFILASTPSDNASLARNLGIGDGRVNAGFKDPKTKQFELKVYERMVKQLTGRSPMEFREWQSRELLAAKMRDLVRTPVRVSEDEAVDRFVKERTTAVLNYVVVRKSWIEKYGIIATDKDIDAWAKDKTNLGSVMVPVRHILVKADKPEEKAAAKEKAQGILDRVKKGEDFAKLAKEFSDDPGSKDNGGQYPGKDVEHFVPPFKATVAKLAPGELSNELTETDFGWHVIKRDPATKEDIAKAFKEGKSLEITKAMAAKIEADIKGGKTGEDAVKAAIAQFGITKPAPPAPKKADAKGDAGAGATAAAGDAGAASEPASPQFTAETDPERPQFLTSSGFNQGGTDPIPGVSGPPAQQVVEFAFKAKAGEVNAPIRTDDGFLVAMLKELKPATRADFDKERDVYMDGMLHEKQNEALAFYVRRLREAAKGDIKIDEKNVFGLEKTGDGGASTPSPMDEEEE
jgi:peptidyl-prolyl cis-trans isomerase D